MWLIKTLGSRSNFQKFRELFYVAYDGEGVIIHPDGSRRRLISSALKSARADRLHWALSYGFPSNLSN